MPVFTLEKRVRKNQLEQLLRHLILCSWNAETAVLNLKRSGFRKDYAYTLLKVSTTLPKGLHVLINHEDLHPIIKDTCIGGLRVKLHFNLEDFVEGIPAFQRKIEQARIHPHVQQTIERLEGPAVKEATHDDEVGVFLAALTDSPHLPIGFRLAVIRQNGDYRIAIPQALLLREEGPPSEHDEDFAESFKGPDKKGAYNELIRHLEASDGIHVHGYDIRKEEAYSLIITKENAHITYKSVNTTTI